ncbi:MAG: energy-coupling factor transporter transmembrane component T [Candidatus Zixiibacteriota bacterium]
MLSISSVKPSALDPRTRLAAIFIPAIIVGITLDPTALILLTAAVAALVIASGVTPTDLCRATLPLLIFCVVTLAMHLLFTRTSAVETISFGFVQLNRVALTIGLLYCWRVALFFAIALSFTRWISQEEFAESIWRLAAPLGKLGIPVQGICMALTISIRFIPQIFAEHRRIEMAQRARGANPSRGWLGRVRQFVPLLVPTMASGLRSINTTADALTVRAWGAAPTRTFYRRSQFAFRDTAAFAALILLVILILALPR